jgi:hypothetical protein
MGTAMEKALADLVAAVRLFETSLSQPITVFGLTLSQISMLISFYENQTGNCAQDLNESWGYENS